MKLPMPAPQLQDLWDLAETNLGQIWSIPSAEVGGVYEHWDKLRHRTPPEGLTSQQWWMGIKLKRIAMYKTLPLADKNGEKFKVALTDTLQRLLHFVDREAAGAIQGMDGAAKQGKFLIRSLIEEAMTSSQLEGAATTRAVAKEMLATGRKPRDQSERMIYNNYLGMMHIKDRGKRKFTVADILELHSILTDGTLDDQSLCGKIRTAEDNVLIMDRGSDRVLHIPPNASELPDRLQLICDFANDESQDSFVHPVVKAIAIHFQIGYDHPFCDGNGRTARALFYWAMMNAGYWMTEYISISSVLRKSQGKYMRAYLYTESDGQDLTYFVAQQLQAIEQAVLGMHEYIAKKNASDRKAIAVLRNAKVGGVLLNHRQRALLAHALKDPERSYTVASHQAAHAVTYPTAMHDLNQLVEAGLLEKARVGKSNLYFPLGDVSNLISN